MTASSDADTVRNLLQLPKDTVLTLVLLSSEHWLAVAEYIRQGHCYIKQLSLVMIIISSSKDTEAVKAIAKIAVWNPLIYEW
jgi:hypothetical protein